MSRLEEIVEYRMTEEQAKAFKLALVWEQLCRKEFPDLPHVRLRKKGDPRKSVLFRHCYGLVKDMKGVLKDEDLHLYLRSQLQVLKAVGCVRVEPAVLRGEKAWRRWKFWKRRYDKEMNTKQTAEEVGVSAPLHAVKREIASTRAFLERKFGGRYARRPVFDAVWQGIMTRWLNYANVSPYYIVLSSWVGEALEGRDIEEVFLFDTGVYWRSITEEVRKAFREAFPEESHGSSPSIP